MRKTLTILLTASLALGAFAAPMADAKKKKKKKKVVIRTATAGYDTPMIGHPDAGGVCSGANGCATFPIGATERFASFSVEDSAAPTTYVLGGQDLDGDNFTDTSFAFCGSTTELVALEPGYEVLLFIGAGPGGASSGTPCAGAGTSGTVTAKFSSKAFKI